MPVIPYTVGMFGPCPSNVRPGMWEAGEFVQEYFVGRHGYGEEGGNRGYVNGERHAPPSGACDVNFRAWIPDEMRRGDLAYQWIKRWFGWGDCQHRWRGWCYDDGYERSNCQSPEHQNHIHFGPDPSATWNRNCIADLPAEARQQAYVVLGGGEGEDMTPEDWKRLGEWLWEVRDDVQEQGRRTRQSMREEIDEHDVHIRRRLRRIEDELGIESPATAMTAEDDDEEGSRRRRRRERQQAADEESLERVATPTDRE